MPDSDVGDGARRESFALKKGEFEQSGSIGDNNNFTMDSPIEAEFRELLKGMAAEDKEAIGCLMDAFSTETVS